ncbi:MAG: ribokinase [Anaerolineae bacterium]|nr:ribokinase [Anaerolineae bacterium]
MARIIVVGSANVDFVVQTPHIPRPGETVLGRDFVMAMGGKGANQAVGAARLGGEVTFVACVGQDVFGDQCLAAYEAEGINTAFVTRDANEATGVALIAVDAGGENSITVASGANMQITPAHVEAASSVFQEADVLVLQLEVPLETVQTAAQLAREHGVTVLLNPAPAQSLARDLLQLVDVFTPNRIELAQLLGLPETEVGMMSDEDLAKRALGLGPSSAVITLGAQGALAAGSWGWTRVMPFAVTPIDTTAAGDAFNAGLALALGRGDALDQAAQYANACGALATTKFGAQPSLPGADAVDLLIGQSK